jgi:hypothetical protein
MAAMAMTDAEKAAWVSKVNAGFAAFMDAHTDILRTVLVDLTSRLPPGTPWDNLAVLVAQVGHPVLQALPQAIPIPDPRRTGDLVVVTVDRQALLIIMRATYGVTPHWQGGTPPGELRCAVFFLVDGAPAVHPFSLKPDLKALN